MGRKKGNFSINLGLSPRIKSCKRNQGCKTKSVDTKKNINEKKPAGRPFQILISRRTAWWLEIMKLLETRDEHDKPIRV